MLVNQSMREHNNYANYRRENCTNLNQTYSYQIHLRIEDYSTNSEFNNLCIIYLFHTCKLSNVLIAKFVMKELMIFSSCSKEKEWREWPRWYF